MYVHSVIHECMCVYLCCKAVQEDPIPFVEDLKQEVSIIK